MRGSIATLLLVLALAGAARAASSEPRVLAIRFGPDLEVNLLDTPGGLSTSMKTIYTAELNAKLPVIVYVSPDGARAASAGVWISQAADGVAMAPATNIGSAPPHDPPRPNPRAG